VASSFDTGKNKSACSFACLWKEELYGLTNETKLNVDVDTDCNCAKVETKFTYSFRLGENLNFILTTFSFSLTLFETVIAKFCV
jgi:hypothetical protein